VAFPDQSNGIAVGDFGTILRTSDGGTTWIDQTIAPSASAMFLSSLAFGSPSVGIVVGRLDSTLSTRTLTRSLILRTVDGGKNWRRIEPPQPNDRPLRGISFGGLTVATAVGDSGLILRSTDSGISWFAQSGIPDPETRIVPPPKYQLNAVSFAGPQIGISVGEGGSIMRTTDGGKTWSVVVSGTTANLFGVSTPNGINAIAVGSGGTALVSVDGGGSWDAQLIETNLDLFAVHFLDEDRGTIVGNLGIVFRTSLASTPTIVLPNDRTVSLKEFELAQNYPNPFNGATTISFRLSTSQPVTLRIHDVLGREVATLMHEVKPPGEYRVLWESTSVPSGVYFCCLHVGSSLVTKRMVLLK
jgi:photosystem II stability/assembly factor-like uncharacterized protein